MRCLYTGNWFPLCSTAAKMLGSGYASPRKVVSTMPLKSPQNHQSYFAAVGRA